MQGSSSGVGAADYLRWKSNFEEISFEIFTKRVELGTPEASPGLEILSCAGPWIRIILLGAICGSASAISMDLPAQSESMDP